MTHKSKPRDLIGLAPSLWSRLLGGVALGLAVLGFVMSDVHAQTTRIKDVTSVQGVRDNQLVGYGLVVGLDGTGDSTNQAPFTTQSLGAMLGQLGVNIPAGTNIQLRNVAAVMVTAQLPAFAQPGQRLDITVSSIANARSLRGGTLLLTPLRGVDGEIYALAQGNLSVGGVGVEAQGSSRQVNHLTVGRIPNGALVEREVVSPFVEAPVVRLELHEADFAMASNVVEAINGGIGQGMARALDARVIELAAPADPSTRVSFMARVQDLPIGAARLPAKVVINARSGSIVMNQAVRLGPAAIAHGNITISVDNQPQVAQPNALAGGETVVTDQADVQIVEDGSRMVYLPGGAQLADVVRALNTLGASPQDLIAILQALRAAGSLQAELEII